VQASGSTYSWYTMAPMKKTMLVLVPLMSLLSGPATAIATTTTATATTAKTTTTAAELSRISVRGQSFVDEFGRVRIFRGWNDISNSPGQVGDRDYNN